MEIYHVLLLLVPLDETVFVFMKAVLEVENILLLVGLFLRFLIGIIVLSTGISKLQHPVKFQQAIQEYKVISPSLDSRFHLSLFATFLIFPLELLTGACLILGTFFTPAIFVTIFLFLGFSLALLINIWRGRHDLSCHCAGVLGDQKVSWWHILRNGGLMLCLLFLLLTSSQTPQPNLIASHLLIRVLLVDSALPMFLLATITIIMMILFRQIKSHWQFLFD